MRNSCFHQLNKTTLAFVALLCVFSLDPLSRQTQAQTDEISQFKNRNQENLANRARVPRAEEPVVAVDTQDEATAAAQAESSRERAEEQAKLLVGVWLGMGSDGTKSFLTFHSDGTLQGSLQGGVSTTSPLGVISDGHGTWRHLGGRQFGKIIMGLRYDINTGRLNGFVKVRSILTINKAGDKMTLTDKLEVSDPDGNVLFTASDTGTATRVKFEPFN